MFPGDPQLHLVQLPPGVDNEAGLRHYRSMENVDYAQASGWLELNAIAVNPNDPYFPQQWGLNKISAPQAWNLSVGSPSVVVAVVDTGIDYTHEDLSANIWWNQAELNAVGGCPNGLDDDANGHIDDCVGWSFYPNCTSDPANCPGDNNPMDVIGTPGLGHGTGIAGIIGAVGNNSLGMTGVMWSARLMAVRVAGPQVWLPAAVNAVDYAWQNGARVINASWGSTNNYAPLYDAILRARQHGVLVVAAAGNQNRDNDVTPYYPASFNLDNIISVAASNPSDDLWVYTPNPAVGSNWGATTVHLAAPGGGDAATPGILTTFPNNRYEYWNGTSEATAFVSGAAGLLWSRNPSLSYLQIKNILLNSVDLMNTLGGRVSSGGRLNLQKALQQVPVPVSVATSP